MSEQEQPVTPGDDFLARHASTTAERKKQAPGPFDSSAKVLTWSLGLAAALVGLAGIGLVTLDRLQGDMLLRANDAEVRARLDDVWPNDAPGSYYETLGEFVELINPDDQAMAKLAAEKAVAADPTRAFAWARIAYLSIDPMEPLAEETINALRASMDHCALCDEELVRWRFNFVLGHWEAMPEDVRQRAFTHADMLRWSGPNAEFLAEMRVKSRAAGIPYDAYRANVDTPVRSWDIVPLEPEAADSEAPASAEG